MRNLRVTNYRRVSRHCAWRLFSILIRTIQKGFPPLAVWHDRGGKNHTWRALRFNSMSMRHSIFDVETETEIEVMNSFMFVSVTRSTFRNDVTNLQVNELALWETFSPQDKKEKLLKKFSSCRNTKWLEFSYE